MRSCLSPGASFQIPRRLPDREADAIVGAATAYVPAHGAFDFGVGGALHLVEQDRAAWPFTCTVHAPHSAMPQPYLVPVIPRWSRRTHRRGVYGSASTDMGLPLTFRVVIEELLGKNPRTRPDRGRGGVAQPSGSRLSSYWKWPLLLPRQLPPRSRLLWST